MCSTLPGPVGWDWVKRTLDLLSPLQEGLLVRCGQLGSTGDSVAGKGWRTGLEQGRASQNHRMVEVGRDLGRSFGLTPPAQAGPPRTGSWGILCSSTAASPPIKRHFIRTGNEFLIPFQKSLQEACLYTARNPSWPNPSFQRKMGGR